MSETNGDNSVITPVGESVNAFSNKCYSVFVGYLGGFQCQIGWLCCFTLLGLKIHTKLFQVGKATSKSYNHIKSRQVWEILNKLMYAGISLIIFALYAQREQRRARILDTNGMPCQTSSRDHVWNMLGPCRSDGEILLGSC